MARKRSRWLRKLVLLIVVLIAAAIALHHTSDTYDRTDWPHWIDEDGDCQDTRQEVLIAESTIPVRFTDARRCKVASGRWVCPYTGRVITDPHELDVDHVVALHAAHEAGGDRWSRDDRRRYANALDDRDHLIAVAKAANRSKSDQGPEQWLPERAAYRCAYLRNWVRIKQEWDLEIDSPEQAAIDRGLEACDDDRVPPRP